MAKSKSGGTRSYIRGRVGADVYSIGKDGAGKKQQVVRSMPESVSNPRTINQMRGRMIMSTIMQVVSALKPIIDHSFDGLTGAQANISEFIRRNYALVKADVAANPSENNNFGLNLYGVKGALPGRFVVASGVAVIPAAIKTLADGTLSYTPTGEAKTVAAFKAATGLTANDYLTIVQIDPTAGVRYARVRIAPTAADDATLSADSFLIEGNATPQNEVNEDGKWEFGFETRDGSSAFIVSIAVEGGYIHNDAVMVSQASQFANVADVALPTYPVGDSAYLNGGNLFGLNEG